MVELIRQNPFIEWLGFLLLLGSLIYVELHFLTNKSHPMTKQRALGVSAFWIGFSALFGLVVGLLVPVTGDDDPVAVAGLVFNSDKMLEYYAAWLIEKGLSVDNIFVIMLIFQSLRVPTELQHRVLYWGILGAIVFRAIFIIGGAALIARFDWIMYLFGAILLYSAIKTVMPSSEGEGEGDADEAPKPGKFREFVGKFLPIANELKGESFFARYDGALKATPLFLALVMVETSDIIFAFDSIPAVFSVTTHNFVAFTSNILAVFGIRAIFFLLAGSMEQLRFLKHGLGLLLLFIAAKLLLHSAVHISLGVSLAVIATILVSIVALEFLFPSKQKTDDG